MRVYSAKNYRKYSESLGNILNFFYFKLRILVFLQMLTLHWFEVYSQIYVTLILSSSMKVARYVINL